MFLPQICLFFFVFFQIISIPKWANVQYEKRNLILKQLPDLNFHASSHNLDGVIVFDSTHEPKTKEELTDTLEVSVVSSMNGRSAQDAL